MGFVDTVRKDVAEFFSILIEKNLARDSYNGENLEVTGHYWIVRNIAEILSTEDVLCRVVDYEVGDNDDECKLIVIAA